MGKKSKFYRVSSGKVVFGVCNGLAEYFEINVMIVRALLVATLFVPMLFPFVAAAYAGAAYLVEEKPIEEVQMIRESEKEKTSD